jgi:type VI secretion system FHA domain protein
VDPDAAQPPGEVSADVEALRAAFLQGAALDASTRLEPAPTWAAHAGALLRSLTAGTYDLLQSRAVTKQSIRAEGTRIAARHNNPLKFAPDATECLRLLLDAQGKPGFLEPLQALREAHEDLQLHQVAMVAGMRAAVFELISRLGPEATEAAEGPPTGPGKWISSLRDAALWRRHRREHAALMSSLDDAFEAAFGREFLRAYEAQARRANARDAAGSGAAGPPEPGRPRR